MKKEILYKFFEHRATPDERSLIRKWLTENPDNQQELLREREFFDALLLSKHTSMKKDAIIMNKQKSTKNLWIGLIKIAAVILLVFGVGYYFHKKAIHDIGLAINTITVPAGQRVNIQLPDGTNVWLNARSELKYPAYFTGNKREIELDGEAFFEVVHSRKKPFIVHTEQCDIEVLGTRFNVEAYTDSKDFVTSLIEGSVRITDRKNNKNTIILSPDYQAVLKDGNLISGKIEDYDLYRWTEGLICFKNTGFIELMQRFEKYYGIEIVVANEKLSDYVFSGKFRISDGIENALYILQKEAPYTFRRNPEDTIIYIE